MLLGVIVLLFFMLHCHPGFLCIFQLLRELFGLCILTTHQIDKMKGNRKHYHFITWKWRLKHRIFLNFYLISIRVNAGRTLSCHHVWNLKHEVCKWKGLLLYHEIFSQINPLHHSSIFSNQWHALMINMLWINNLDYK